MADINFESGCINNEDLKKIGKLFRKAIRRLKLCRNNLSQGNKSHRRSWLDSSYEPRYAKTYFRPYADSEAPDQPAHPRNLIRVFTVHLQND